jgi:serine phosphatase RsbU (regulator of sigma subunit)/PAS domain-containing protein
MLGQSEGIAGLLFGLFADARVGLVLLDTELRYVLVNQALADVHGVPVDDHTGRFYGEVVPDLVPTLEPVLDRVLTGESVTNVEIEARGSTRLASYYPLRDASGQIGGVGGVLVDISDLRHARDSERYLRDLLGEERAVLHEVFARAPAGIALLWGPDNRIRLANDRFRDLAFLDEDPTGRPLREALPDLWPIARRQLDEVRETGRSVAREDFAIPAKDPEREGAFEGKRYLTFTIDPIRPQGEEHAGLLVVVHETTDQVRRRARLERELREERRIVTALQRSLLPRSLPAIPGGRLAARYEAAGGRFDVGGDFYDAFGLADDRGWVLVVGDVCGKGPEAAALTAMARYTLRASAESASGPAALLQHLNSEMLRHESEVPGDVGRFATVALAWIRALPGGGHQARLAGAGHPDTLLICADGRTKRFASSGPPCGSFPEAAYTELEARLDPGEALVLYTDGVLDAGAPDRQLTVEELAEALARRAGAGADALADVVAAAVEARGGGEPRDDHATLVFGAD